MMREIILAKAAEENQLFVLNARLPSRLPREKIRHLVLTSDCRWPAGSDVLEGISNMWQVRSLTVNGECPPRLIIPSKMKMLRVLDLEDSINATDEHLSGIGELRQLSIWGSKRQPSPSYRSRWEGSSSYSHWTSKAPRSPQSHKGLRSLRGCGTLWPETACCMMTTTPSAPCHPGHHASPGGQSAALMPGN